MLTARGLVARYADKEVHDKNVSGATKRTKYPLTTMHSSRMRTARLNGRLGGIFRGVGVCLGGAPPDPEADTPLLPLDPEADTHTPPPAHCMVG